MSFPREIPGKLDPSAGDASAAFHKELSNPGEKTALAKPAEGTVGGPVENSFNHPIYATTNLADFTAALNERLSRFTPEQLASAEIPDALRSYISSSLIQRS